MPPTAPFGSSRIPSARRTQPSQRDHDEPADRRLGRQGAGGCEGVEAVARELVRGDVVSELAGLCALGQQISDHGTKLLLRPSDLLIPMQERCEFGVTMPLGLEGDECEGLEHSFESRASVVSLVSNRGEILEVAGDLTFVPSEQDRFDA